MHRIWNSKVFKCLATILIIITCTSCKAFKPYKISDYLIELANQSGISLSQEKEDAFSGLLKWEVVSEEDYELLNEDLFYGFLSKTINNLIDDDTDSLLNNWISPRSNDELIDQNEAIKVINKAVNYINNPELTNEYDLKEKDIKHIDNYIFDEDELEYQEELEIGDIVYLEDDDEYKKIIEKNEDEYLLIDPTIEEIFNELNIEGSTEIDFEDAEIIPYGDEERISYENSKYDLLASTRHTFNSNGFRIAYSFNSSGIDVRVSKSGKDKVNMFFDISLSNLKPTYKWKYNNGKVEDAFLKVNYKLTNELGLSTGKYSKYYLDFKDLDSSSFSKLVKSMFKTSDDEIECTIPICQIKTPIPNVPFASFNIDVVAKIYVTGKVEIIAYNSGIIGFETKDGNFRVIKDVEKDIDFQIGGSARAVAGLNFNLEAVDYRLMDVEFDAGARAAVSSTLHLYDEYGNDKQEKIDVPYSTLQEISKENNDVRVCGDISLNWISDIQLNTSKTMLYKYGLTYRKNVLDTSDQIFSNMTHIENWQLVKKCTRKNRTIVTSTPSTPLNSNKIVLSKYSLVIVKGNSVDLPIVSLPNGYTSSDLIIKSDAEDIVGVNGLVLTAKEIGSTKIEIKTRDDKYKAYINILVSTG